MNKPSIFIDLIIDEKISTDYMRMNTDLPILENNVFGKFIARGMKVETIDTIRLLIRMFKINFNNNKKKDESIQVHLIESHVGYLDIFLL